jgi:hypothetical protein
VPISIEVYEDGRVLRLGFVDNVSIQDIDDVMLSEYKYRQSVKYTTHTLYDFCQFHHPPMGAMRARHASAFTHPRSGKIAVLGASPLPRAGITVVAQLTGSITKTKFFETETEAWIFLREAIAKDKHIEA